MINIGANTIALYVMSHLSTMQRERDDSASRSFILSPIVLGRVMSFRPGQGVQSETGKFPAGMGDGGRGKRRC